MNDVESMTKVSHKECFRCIHYLVCYAVRQNMDATMCCDDGEGCTHFKRIKPEDGEDVFEVNPVQADDTAMIRCEIERRRPRLYKIKEYELLRRVLGTAGDWAVGLSMNQRHWIYELMARYVILVDAEREAIRNFFEIKEDKHDESKHGE